MTPRQFIDFLGKVSALKTAYRHNWTDKDRRESVADHSWRLALMPLLLKNDFPEIDTDKVIKMCLIHDIGEALTGDIPCFKKTDCDEAAERLAIEELLSGLPVSVKDELTGLFEEMDGQKTAESKLYKALDNLEAVISHNEANISTWEEHEYRLQFTHGADKVLWSEWLKELKSEIDRDTSEKIAASGSKVT